MSYVIEIATTDFSTTAAAVAGGADRIELCAALSEGGITPSHGMMRVCRESFEVALFPIIRPRGGDFHYSDEELEVMLDDVRYARSVGCDGVVLGLLKKDGTLPRRKLARLVKAAYPMEVTFHRAFDRCADPFEMLEQLVEAGVQRILTSGQKPTAPEGSAVLRQLVEQADHRIIIMPGSGVRADNVKELQKATGAEEFHSSLRSRRESPMQFRHPSFGAGDFQLDAIDPDAVRALRAALEE
ncbi:copper homeostasis protein CutC [Flaviaesturariibacter flavus]|uniref:PF03932 family protein CutC n=1 Tax=Flaviaesturariibacter flavus TaxID=2502780 RepID=A0A4R1BNN2_9BACT|nr:copper homeostasis protein CutC [Flaviaesturariibacter flavus]TCJ19159.1 copper homeostasis protein CutC [Flaviaesturariibacter flavus]